MRIEIGPGVEAGELFPFRLAFRRVAGPAGVGKGGRQVPAVQDVGLVLPRNGQP